MVIYFWFLDPSDSCSFFIDKSSSLKFDAPKPTTTHLSNDLKTIPASKSYLISGTVDNEESSDDDEYTPLCTNTAQAMDQSQSSDEDDDVTNSNTIPSFTIDKVGGSGVPSMEFKTSTSTFNVNEEESSDDEYTPRNTKSKNRKNQENNRFIEKNNTF